MSVTYETERHEASERLRAERQRKVNQAVERAARRMDANAEEREILEEAADRIAERVTRPIIEAAEEGDRETAELLLLGQA